MICTLLVDTRRPARLTEANLHFWLRHTHCYDNNPQTQVLSSIISAYITSICFTTSIHTFFHFTPRTVRSSVQPSQHASATCFSQKDGSNNVLICNASAQKERMSCFTKIRFCDRCLIACCCLFCFNFHCSSNP